MSGRFIRVCSCLLLSLMIAACGGGGGGGGSKSSSSSAAPLDSDRDGRPDAQDAFPNDPKEWADTDKDGVGDNSDAFPNDASETLDTDKDGVGDNKDQFPNDPTETVDTDKDGVGDNSDPDPMGQPIPAWTTFQGDAQHTGWIDVTLATGDFKQRWSKDIELASSLPGAAGDGYIFFNNGGTLIALDARSGETLWTRSVSTNQSFYTYNQPAYADGIVYIQTGGEGNRLLWALNAIDGSVVFQFPVVLQTSQFMATVVQDGTVYIAGDYYLIYAIDAKTGLLKWTQTLNQSDQFTPAIAGDKVIVYGGNYLPELTVVDRSSGNLMFDIADSGFTGYGWGMSVTPVVVGDYVLAQHDGRLVAFNLASKVLAWEVTSTFVGQPVVKGEHFYIINNGIIETRLIATGALLSSITGNNQFIGDPLLTNNLLFVRDQQNTYAYQLDTGALVWTLTGESGGFLMAEGALVVFTAGGVVTIDLEGDIDADGLPDWWEKRLKKNINPASDTDVDGLTALEEFMLFTNPFVADTDGDGLLDGEESSGTSSPLKADTDGDGLNDYAEVKTHLTDPTKVDSDGDSLSDAEEIVAGLNPLDANDAVADSDGDGFSNLHEVRANTALNDVNSHPQATDWSMQTGNSQRNSYNPLLLNDTRFSERWTATSYVSLNAPLTAAGTLILRTSNDQYVGWDSGTGAELWRFQSTANNYGSLSTHAGKLVYFTNSGVSARFAVLDAATGTNLLSKALTSSNNMVPLLGDDTLYAIDSGNRAFNAYNLSSGNLLWTSAVGNEYFHGGNQHLLGNGQFMALSSNAISLFSTSNGSLVKTITLTGGGISRVALGSKSNVIVRTQDGKLSSINLADGNRSWSNQDCQGSHLAVGNGHVYVLGQSKVCVLNEQTGALSWTLALPNNWSSSNIVLTASHLFYSDGSATHGVNLALKSITWSIAKGASELALAADGTLYLQTSSSVTAIDTEGDTDADGLPQWWERRYGGDLTASADVDADGLTNLQEFANKTNPLLADTDGDGLNDGVEVNTTKTDPLLADTDKDGLNDGVEANTYATNPLVVDSDGDGIDDAREIALALNPLDEDDASEDDDGDGFSNSDEIYSGSSHTQANSTPMASDWAMKQGNAAHNGFQPYRLDESDFGLRWSKTFSLQILPVATGDKHVFVTQGRNSNASSLFTLNAVDGKQQWQQDFSQSYLGDPTYASGQVVLQTSSPATLRRFNADSGTAAANVSFTGSLYFARAPSLLGNNAYTIMDSNSIVATRLDTGANLWSAAVSTSGTDIALNNQYLFYADKAQIRVLERSTGAPAFTINTQSANYSYLVLGSRNNILTLQNGLISYDITSRSLNWHIPSGNYRDYILPVAANGQVLYVNGGALTSVDEVDGSLRWSWSPDNQYISSNIVATLSHIFIASGSTTYALSATTGELLWSYNAGGNLALGADGALYIQSDRQLVAINLEGDSDSDGMPDWWERHYGLDVNDASDAAFDLDSDGLTNLQEFNLSTYANQVDSDGDSISDAVEVNTHHTDPTSIDSDADGMRDDWEIANSFNPLDAGDRDTDTDGDSVPNYFEFLVGTDPNNALSLPAMFSAGVYSFEDAVLPAGWLLSSDTTDVSISLNNASHGTKALQIRNKADISFVGFFAASDLALDVKAGCDYPGKLEIYVDDQLMNGTTINAQWNTIKTVIPLGMHTVSVRSNSSSCSVYLDNIVISSAKTNAELGIQFMGVYNNELQFINANKTIVRKLQAKSPVLNSTVQDIATLGNEKVVVVFNDNETRIGVLDLATFNWRYFEGLDVLSNSYDSSSSGLVAQGNFAYLATYNRATSTPNISRVNLTSGAITLFGAHAYTSLALDSAGFIYAYSDAVVYKYDPTSLALVSQMNTVGAQKILIDNDNRLIVVAYNEALRYNAQRLIDLRISFNNSPRSAIVTERNELLIANQNNQIIWYSADWQRSQTLALPVNQLAAFPQLDSDNDGLPDWWELANGLNIADPSDATSDSDSDGLTALEEFAADTNPALDDTDGDMLNDGDEVKEFNTNPHHADTDADGLTDAQEVVQYLTNPLVKDTDADDISDFLEVTHFLTDPNDATSKPAALINFVESFENVLSGWITPTDANAGWAVVSDLASSGSKSLRSGAIGNNQKAAVEWSAVFNQSTMSFDARVSSESCCDHLFVYVDGVQQIYVRNNDQWQPHSLPISAGYHTIKFVYQKDGSSASGSDAAWIDNIRVQ